jgi:hypothetical protein
VEASRLVTQKAPYHLGRDRCVPLSLGNDVQDLPLVIDGSPKVMNGIAFQGAGNSFHRSVVHG